MTGDVLNQGSRSMANDLGWADGLGLVNLFYLKSGNIFQSP